MTGTIGPRQCSLKWPLLGAIIGLPFLIWNRDTSPSFNIVAFLSSLIFEWKIEWNSEYFSCKSKSETVLSVSKKKKQFKRCHLIKHCLMFGFGIIVFSIVLTSTIYQNLQVEINGERVKIKDVLADFFRSQEFIQLYQQLMNVMKQLYEFYLQFGLKGIWTQVWTALDSESDKQAFEVNSIIFQYLTSYLFRTIETKIISIKVELKVYSILEEIFCHFSNINLSNRIFKSILIS